MFMFKKKQLENVFQIIKKDIFSERMQMMRDELIWTEAYS